MTLRLEPLVIVLAIMVATPHAWANPPEPPAAINKEDPQKFSDERDRRYMEMFRGITETINQRFSDQAVAVTAAFAANEKAIHAAFDANEKYNTAILASAKEAVQKAEAATEARFASVNEFRAQLKDQASTLLPGEEFATQLRGVDDRLTRIESAQSEITGGLLLVVALIPIAAGLIVWSLRRKLRDVEQ
jgi:hypothetical protein